MTDFRRGLLIVAVILATVAGAIACDGIVVGRLASVDGSVLLGHNEENALDRVLEFRKIPPIGSGADGKVDLGRGGQIDSVPETCGFLWSENPGLEFSDGYLNESGVAVVSIQCLSREDGYDALVARGEIRHGGIGYMLRRLVAQRADSAREGMELIGRLVEEFGYVDSGRTYAVADPREAWVVEVVRGRRWVAQRVPDDAVVILPARHVIGEIDLDDADNFRVAGPGQLRRQAGLVRSGRRQAVQLPPCLPGCRADRSRRAPISRPGSRLRQTGPVAARRAAAVLHPPPQTVVGG